MKNWLWFVLLAVLGNFLLWHIVDGLYWLETHMRMYTEWGKAALYWSQHVLFGVVYILLLGRFTIWRD